MAEKKKGNSGRSARTGGARRSGWLGISLVLLTAGLWFWRSQAQPPPESLPFPRNLEALITLEKERQSIPGIAVAVVRDGKIIYLGCQGTADWNGNLPVGPNTAFRVASVSKTLTALTVLRLAEQGKLDLDAPIQKYVQVYPKKEWKVTLRQLLSHLGGVRGYTDTEQYPTQACSSVTESLPLFQKDPLVYRPGTKFLYSSYGYNLLGAAVQQACGKDYLTCIQETVLLPAGMRDTVVDSILKPQANWAVGYYRSSSGGMGEVPAYDGTCRLPSAGFRASVTDLSHLALALLEGKLVSAETRKQMWTRARTEDGSPVDYGMGWRLGEYRGMAAAYHDGTLPGARAMLYLLPEKQLGVVILANLYGANLDSWLPRLLDLVLPPGSSSEK